MGAEKRSTLNVLFIIKKSKLLKNGEAPICMRITVNKQIAEVSIKRSIPIELWNQKKECSKGKDRMAMELNMYIGTVRAKILQIHRELEIDGKPITANVIRDRYYGRDKIEHTLLNIYAEHNEKCRALIGKEYTASTVVKFDTAINRLKEFIKCRYAKDDILLEELDGQFIRDLGFWLKTEKNCRHNTTLKHLKILKKVVRIALANEWLKKDPFYGIRLKFEEVNIEFLSKEELDRLINKNFSVKRLELVRDIFVFCCFTALAFTDVYQLAPQHLIKDNNGALWIRKARQKTNQISNIPLLSIPLSIIRKYENHPECLRKGVLLPVMSNQKMNAYLKEIADLCGIKKRLTTHVARHTAATVVFLANKVSIENVSKILGHSNIKMTQHYAKILDSSIMRDMENVEQNFAECQAV